MGERRRDYVQRSRVHRWRTYAVRQGAPGNCVVQDGPLLTSLPCGSCSPLVFLRMMYRLSLHSDVPGVIYIKPKNTPYKTLSFQAEERRGLLWVRYRKNGGHHNVAIDPMTISFDIAINSFDNHSESARQISQEDWQQVTRSIVDEGNRGTGDLHKYVYCRVNMQQSILFFRNVPWLYALPICTQFRSAAAQQQENFLLKQLPQVSFAPPFVDIIDAFPAASPVGSQQRSTESETEDSDSDVLRDMRTRARAVLRYRRLVTNWNEEQRLRIVGIFRALIDERQSRMSHQGNEQARELPAN